MPVSHAHLFRSSSLSSAFSAALFQCRLLSELRHLFHYRLFLFALCASHRLGGGERKRGSKRGQLSGFVSGARRSFLLVPASVSRAFRVPSSFLSSVHSDRFFESALGRFFWRYLPSHCFRWLSLDLLVAALDAISILTVGFVCFLSAYAIDFRLFRLYPLGRQERAPRFVSGIPISWFKTISACGGFLHFGNDQTWLVALPSHGQWTAWVKLVLSLYNPGNEMEVCISMKGKLKSRGRFLLFLFLFIEGSRPRANKPVDCVAYRISALMPVVSWWTHCSQWTLQKQNMKKETLERARVKKRKCSVGAWRKLSARIARLSPSKHVSRPKFPEEFFVSF